MDYTVKALNELFEPLGLKARSLCFDYVDKSGKYCLCQRDIVPPYPEGVTFQDAIKYLIKDLEKNGNKVYLVHEVSDNCKEFGAEYFFDEGTGIYTKVWYTVPELLRKAMMDIE